ncbi:protein translocase subunit SecD [Aliikangiella marina]|uniref:Protein translocase subunit SecD n=1 Tax=Aliikangiella marina TaxID=1712262 RepID=A0A545T6R3_9GAMM|nr:protein translocase subunit SecD [Aliikangiella marina]TQV72914.1 protein translocase subunit SecD [Aliikangiella marina]
MKTYPKNYGYSASNRTSKWQYLIIAVALIFMALSALPNFFPKKQRLLIHSNGAEKAAIQASELYTQLADANLPVNAINSTEQGSELYFANLSDAKKAYERLVQVYGDEYTIMKSEKSGIPQWLVELGLEPIKLGLDLRGGVLFILDVDGDKAFSDRIVHIRDSVKSITRDNKIRDVNVAIANKEQVVVNIYQPQNLQKVAAEIQNRFPLLSMFYESDTQLKLFYAAAAKNSFHQEIMSQSLSTMRGRIEELGITEAVVQRQGRDRIRIELPGASNPDDVRPIIGATASLQFFQLQERGGKYFKTESGESIAVSPVPIFSGKHIKNAKAGRDEMGMPLVHLTLDAIGGDKMLRFSARNIGKPMVTVFSEYYQNTSGETLKKEKVISVATIQAQLGSRFSITHLSSPEKAQELALLLRAGSLDAPITIAKERTINATLGEKNIENGMAALTLGIGVTLLFMIAWYRQLGVIANVALSFNLLCLLGLMSLLPGAVLTLPGIAGFVLTVGMAVDTNVLIFERIKEELKRGRAVSIAVEQGYKNAFATILDANITTLLTALILYAIGYGPVKGFAITLGLGVLTSMFTGVFISKVLTRLFYTNSNSRREKGVMA